MPEYSGLSGKITYNPLVLASLLGDLSVTNSGRNTLDGALTVLNQAAASLKAAWKRIWIEVYIDDGRGFPVLVPNSQIGSDMSIVESLDGWSDELNMSLVGDKYSPLLSSLVRGKRKVEVWVTYGSPGSEFQTSTPTFSGYINSGSFQFYPPVTKIKVLDGASKYSEEKAEATLEANSGRSRLSVMYDLLNQGTPVPLGVIDLGGDGGTVNKSFSTPTDARKFDVVRDFISPTGAYMYFSNQRLNVRRFQFPASVDRLLTKADISIPLTVDPPSTTDADVITGVSVKFSTSSITGDRTQVETQIWHKVMRVPTHVQYQDVGGAVHPNPVTSPESVDRIFKKIVTTTTYRGSTLVYSQVDEYGFFSPRIARQEYKDDGTGTFVVGPRLGTHGIPVRRRILAPRSSDVVSAGASGHCQKERWRSS
jgi:hypothetical protein